MPKQGAFFDLDKTVIAKASMVAFGGPFRSEGLISRRMMLRALWGQLVYMHLGASEQKLARIRESVLALTRGWDQQQVRSIVAETLDDVVEPIIYAEALELIEHHRSEGHLVYLVSASPEEIVEPLGDHLGVDGVIASRAKVDEEGRYTGEMEQYAYGPYKADLMRAEAERQGIDLAASYAYSDSYTDVPMLEVVGHAVVVNPDRVLLKLARERGWEVRAFERPVRLRDRMPVPPAGPTAAAGVLAGATGLGLWWWLARRRAAPPTRWQRVSRSAASWPRRLRER